MNIITRLQIAFSDKVEIYEDWKTATARIKELERELAVEHVKLTISKQETQLAQIRLKHTQHQLKEAQAQPTLEEWFNTGFAQFMHK